jgi:hypothetical protein
LKQIWKCGWIIHWKTPVYQAGLQDALQVYTDFSPKKHHKKPNLWDSQMKTVFSSFSVVVVMTHDSRARKKKLSRVITTITEQLETTVFIWESHKFGFLWCFFGEKSVYTCSASWRPAWWTGVFQCMIHSHFQICFKFVFNSWPYKVL